MQAMTDHRQEPPFGALSPTSVEAFILDLSRRTGGGKVGALVRSLLYRAAGGKNRGPVDLEIFGGQRARLHPGDNLCEKRVFASDRHWDRKELDWIERQAASGTGPFRFVDVGANVGLYTLGARAAAVAAGRPFRAAAVEPQPEMLRRLRFNVAASGAGDEIMVCPWAATDARTTLRFAHDGINAGTGKILEDGSADGAFDVEGRPLLDALTEAGLDGIDVMKIDVEGAEYPALKAFFDAARPELRPTTIIIEAGKGDLDWPAIRLCLDQGYRVADRGRLNAILAL